MGGGAHFETRGCLCHPPLHPTPPHRHTRMMVLGRYEGRMEAGIQTCLGGNRDD